MASLIRPRSVIRFSRAIALAFAATAALCSVLDAASYRLTRQVPIGGKGGWDYFSVDVGSHRLFASHSDGFVILDTRTDTVCGRIEGVRGVHGIAIADGSGKGFTSDGWEDKVGVVDLSSLKVLTKLPAGSNPDAILFVPATNEVYAFNGRSHTATVIAVGVNTVVATVPLPGKPEFAQYDPKQQRILVNLEDTSSVCVIDPRKRAVSTVWSLGEGQEPTGLALDPIHRRLFAGCSNSRVVVLDADTGRVVAQIPAGQGIDAVAYDAGTGLVLIPNGRDGTLTVAHEDSSDHYTVVQTLATQVSARTLALDPESHKLYLGCADFEKAAPGKRGRMVADSFRILVCELTP